MLVAENIKKLRKQKGISQIELSAQIDAYPDYISWWESGKRIPSLKQNALVIVIVRDTKSGRKTTD